MPGMHDGKKRIWWKPWLLTSNWISLRDALSTYFFKIGLQAGFLSQPLLVYTDLSLNLFQTDLSQKAVKVLLGVPVVLLSFPSLRLTRKLLWNGHKFNCLLDNPLFLQTCLKQCNPYVAPHRLLLTQNLWNFPNVTVKTCQNGVIRNCL